MKKDKYKLQKFFGNAQSNFQNCIIFYAYIKIWESSRIIFILFGRVSQP